MKIRKFLKIENREEFYKLNSWYKWAIYVLGWAATVSSLILIIVELLLYHERKDEKVKKPEDDKVQYTYQKVPYWIGWICGLPLLIIILLGVLYFSLISM